jgi:Domain of unknown function (DUF4439)
MSAPDLAALQSALAAEQTACYGYGLVGAYLHGGAASTAQADWVAHQVARDRLTAIISSAGATPVPAAVAYQLPVVVRTEDDARALAAFLESGVARAYLGLVGVTDLALRRVGTAGLQAAALRAAAWSQRTTAFPGLTG